MHIELQVENRRANIKRVVVRGQAVIGRQKHCDIRVVSTEISREHCRIEIQKQSAVLIDLGSTNGTFLNRKRLEPHAETLLKDGDKILIGPAAFTVVMVAAADEESRQTLDEEQLTAGFGHPDEETIADVANDRLIEPELIDSSDESDETVAEFDDEQMQEILAEDAVAEVDEDDIMAGVASDAEMEEMSEDDAFNKFLKEM